MGLMLIRTVLIYTITFIIIRLMGKRQVGEMQPFEFVITLIIADLACVPMAELAVPLVHGVVPILGLFLLHFFICFLSRKFMWFRYGVTGRPAIVVSPSGIDYKELKKLNMTIDDLMESIRGCNYFSIDEIAYAIMETNGKLCVIPKAENTPLTQGDVDLQGEPSALPVNLIMDGKIMKENLKLTQVDDAFLQKYYKKVNVAGAKQILLFTIDNNGNIFIQPKNKGRYYTFTAANYKGGDQW